MNNLKHPITGAAQYLEVKVPQTTNGTLLAYDSNQQPIYKTKYLPFSAKKRLDQRNTRLPQHLRLGITVKTNQDLQLKTTVQEREQLIQLPVIEETPKNKGGRPKKTQ